MGFMKIHLHIIKWKEVIWRGQPKLDWMKEGGEKRQTEELVIKQQCFIVRQPIHLIWS